MLVMASARQDELRALIDYLSSGGASGAADPPAAAGVTEALTWRDWRIERLGGGVNNRVFRAMSAPVDLVVKLTIRDARDRAGREFASLRVLEAAGLDVAPRALLLDRERYPLPVVVQTWVAGRVGPEPPAGDDEWQRWVELMATFHAVTPESSGASLPNAALAMSGPADGIRRIHDLADVVPAAEQQPSLRALIERVEAHRYPALPAPRLGLCRSDPNISNMVRRPDRWASVDWEASGWGDPAFDIVELIVHPAHLGVPLERWDWFVERYTSFAGDPGIPERIAVYRPLMLTWWAANLARRLYRGPLGDAWRLGRMPANWYQDARRMFDRYVECALMCLH